MSSYILISNVMVGGVLVQLFPGWKTHEAAILVKSWTHVNSETHKNGSSAYANPSENVPYAHGNNCSIHKIENPITI